MTAPLDGWHELQSSFAPVDANTGERLRRIPPDLGTARRAAVLVPLILDPSSGAKLVYTVRKGHLNDHAGQISFPGGSADPKDESLLETALREAEEEIDLPPEAVEVIGSLEDMYIPPSNFLVKPFVGILRPGAKFTLAPDEVEEIFVAPLDTLLDRNTFDRRLWTREGRELDVPVFVVRSNEKTYDIWGATAAITASLLARLGWQHPDL
ncbi:MAG: NUDIX hydrolase [Rubrobacter sp.]